MSDWDSSRTRDRPVGRRGRWRSGEQSRGKILEAARARFAAEGYKRATVRAIAADADVDPSMIGYFFGSKDKLFAAAMSMPDSPREPIAQLFDEDPDTVGPRLVRRFLELWDATEQPDPLVALTRSAHTDERAGAMLREFLEQEFVAQIAERLGGPDARMRAGLICSELLGVAFTRYVIRLDPIASADHDTLSAWLGRTVQSILNGSIDGGTDLEHRAGG